ncbi:hypothetical protein [Spiroplasma endosymbiont of Amphibalanus improvisus]|uniref:hypothetical protein n=1 Tax=Spiroplasma endosymbiont of Amphibalanus improvisus TaxID=3066327 RepID=UPI00313C2F50
MKLLILGNGFEINFNEKFNDFNNKFKKWITEIASSEEKIYDLIDNITRTNINNDEIILFKKCIVTLSKNLNTKKFFYLEDTLKEIGSNLTKEAEEIDDIENKELIFNIFKIIVGYYIEKTSWDSVLFLTKFNKMNYLNNVQFPNYIFTTNYTNTCNIFLKNWSELYEGITLIKPQVLNIHGKIDLKATWDKKYSSIKINLDSKENWKYFQQILNKNNFRELDIEIFGLNMKNDENILKSIFKLLLNNKIVILKYYFVSLGDILDFMETIHTLINEIISYDYKVAEAFSLIKVKLQKIDKTTNEEDLIFKDEPLSININNIDINHFKNNAFNLELIFLKSIKQNGNYMRERKLSMNLKISFINYDEHHIYKAINQVINSKIALK